VTVCGNCAWGMFNSARETAAFVVGLISVDAWHAAKSTVALAVITSFERRIINLEFVFMV